MPGILIDFSLLILITEGESFMLKINAGILDTLLSQKNKITEVTGFPDSGTSSSVIALLGYLNSKYNKQCLYIASENNMMQPLLFKKLANNNIVISLFKEKDYNAVFEVIKAFGPEVDYIVIDDFTRLVLHRRSATIKNILSTLDALIKQFNFNLILVNQFRYDINQKRIRPLYEKFITSYLSLKLTSTRINDLDIELSIESQKTSKNIRISSNLSTIISNIHF